MHPCTWPTRATPGCRASRLAHMSEAELVQLDAEGWRDFRAVRLTSLAESPLAFGSRHADGPADEPRARRMQHRRHGG